MFENPAHQCAWLSTFHPELNDTPEKIMQEQLTWLDYQLHIQWEQVV